MWLFKWKKRRSVVCFREYRKLVGAILQAFGGTVINTKVTMAGTDFIDSDTKCPSTHSPAASICLLGCKHSNSNCYWMGQVPTRQSGVEGLELYIPPGLP